MARKLAAFSRVSRKSESRSGVQPVGGRTRSGPAIVDPEDAPEWTEEQLDRAELAVGGEVVRPATGTLTRGPGRPALANPKRQVSVRLDPDVLDALRGSGPGWQGRMNAALRKALGLEN